MKYEFDELIMQIKPDEHFIDEYLTLKFGSKSQYNYFFNWRIVDLESNYFKTMHGEAFCKKYAGNIFVKLYRGPYTDNYIAKDTVELVFTNDHRMKRLYQYGEIGKVEWFYDETFTPEEKLEYATGKKTLTWEWEDDIERIEKAFV